MLLIPLLLAAVPTCASADAPSLAEARALALGALGVTGASETGLMSRAGTSRLFGYEVPWTTSVDAEGRFLTTFGGALPRKVGFDGASVWVQQADRTVRALVFGERVDELLAAWILSGFWTLEQCPIEFGDPRLKGDDPDDGLLHIPFQLNEALAGFADPVRGVIRLEREGFSVTEAVWKRAGRVSGIGIAEGAEAGEGVELSYSATLGELREPLEVARHLQSIEQSKDFFARPQTAGGGRFDAQASAQLEVVRSATGHLLVQAAIDGELAWFFLDSGAGMSMLDRSLAEKLKPEVLGEIGVGGVGGSVPSQVSRFELLELGPMSLEAPVFATIELDGVREMLGHDVDGLLGYDVFARCVAAFSVAEDSIALFDPADFDPPAGTVWEDIVLFERHPAVRARVEGHEALLRIDTGANALLDLETPAIERWGLLEGRETRSSHSGGIGGALETLSGELKSLDLGGHRFERVPVEFVQATSGFHGSGTLDGNLGLQALEPFEVFFDYQRARVGFLSGGR